MENSFLDVILRVSGDLRVLFDALDEPISTIAVQRLRGYIDGQARISRRLTSVPT